MADDTLKGALIELIRSCSEHRLRLFLGGGYGLYLKQVHLTTSKERTVLPVEAWPRPRGTPDLDVFVPSEILVDAKHMAKLREVLDRLGYEPVAKFMHFEKKFALGSVRVELLTGPIDSADLGKVKINKPRVRPKGDVELHAYLANEAVTLNIEPLMLPLGGDLSVLIPNAFAFLLMKLHAASDRFDDEYKQLGRHHALDVYRVLAMLTEIEEQLVRRLRAEYQADPAVKRAAEIVATHFIDATSLGVIRMREHELVHNEMKIGVAVELLRDLFSV